LFLTCSGDLTLNGMTTAWREVQLVLAELGWKQILIDVTGVQNGPDTAELFDLAKLFWRNFPKSGRMALVVRWDQSTLAKLLETLLRSVGVYLTVFVSEEMAEAWIVENSQNTSTITVGHVAENCGAI
jgi:ABC-type transporter Mla MlaB component